MVVLQGKKTLYFAILPAKHFSHRKNDYRKVNCVITRRFIYFFILGYLAERGDENTN